jgi:hypothetical protein
MHGLEKLKIGTIGDGGFQNTEIYLIISVL